MKRIVRRLYLVAIFSLCLAAILRLGNSSPPPPSSPQPKSNSIVSETRSSPSANPAQGAQQSPPNSRSIPEPPTKASSQDKPPLDLKGLKLDGRWRKWLERAVKAAYVHPQCWEVTRAAHTGFKDDPRFFVQCQSVESSAVGFMFSRSDLEAGKPSRPINKDAFVETCMDQVRSMAPFPSTVRFNGDLASTFTPKGDVAIVAEFEAKTIYGSTMPFRARCLIGFESGIKADIVPR